MEGSNDSFAAQVGGRWKGEEPAETSLAAGFRGTREGRSRVHSIDRKSACIAQGTRRTSSELVLREIESIIYNEVESKS